MYPIAMNLAKNKELIQQYFEKTAYFHDLNLEEDPVTGCYRSLTVTAFYSGYVNGWVDNELGHTVELVDTLLNRKRAESLLGADNALMAISCFERGEFGRLLPLNKDENGAYTEIMTVATFAGYFNGWRDFEMKEITHKLKEIESRICSSKEMDGKRNA